MLLLSVCINLAFNLPTIGMINLPWAGLYQQKKTDLRNLWLNVSELLTSVS